MGSIIENIKKYRSWIIAACFIVCIAGYFMWRGDYGAGSDSYYYNDRVHEIEAERQAAEQSTEAGSREVESAISQSEAASRNIESAAGRNRELAERNGGDAAVIREGQQLAEEGQRIAGESEKILSEIDRRNGISASEEEP